MANFHTDNLVIAAHDKDMLNVLRTFARNLNSRFAATKFGEGFESIEDVEELYSVVQPAIDNWYWLAFTPSEGEPDNDEAAWKSGTDGLSETAGVTLFKRGSLYVLWVGYSTPWCSNREQVELFAQSLPAGNYGFGFLDADEYDGYENVTEFAACETGGARWRVVRDGATSRERLWSELENLARAWALGEADDLATVAFNVAVCSWTEYGTPGDGGSRDLREALSALGGNPVAANFETVDACQRGRARQGGVSAFGESCSSCDAGELVEKCLRKLTKFPLYLAVPNADFAQSMPRDSLVAGSKVGMRMRFFGSGLERRICLDVQSGGTWVGTVGYVRGETGNSWLNIDSDLAQLLALLLPYLSASIESVMPKSHWGGRPSSVPPKLVLKVELCPVGLEDLVKGIEQRVDTVINGNRDKGGVSW